MDDQRAFSSSVDDKKEQVPRQSDVVWSELANPCGKEFELPSVHNPLSSNASENTDNLASPFQLFDPPTVIHHTFLDEMIDSSTVENLVDSLPVSGMATSRCHTISMDDEQKGEHSLLCKALLLSVLSLFDNYHMHLV